MYRFLIKPAADIFVALLALIISSPIWLFITALLFFANKGKPFFVQPRPGRNGELFSVIKFKTMTDEKDEHGHLLPDEDRLTAVGKFVRRTSLDELPQLFNVARGDMSFIGPRPLLQDYLPLYSSEQARRHEVKPGITGWAQVNGRNAISWEEKFKYDIYYIDHLSFLLDFRILFITIGKVLKGEGISSENSATMERFTGSQ